MSRHDLTKRQSVVFSATGALTGLTNLTQSAFPMLSGGEIAG
jgi:hypothetical protein